MTDTQSKPEIAGALFAPIQKKIARNSGYLEVLGWCQKSFLDEGFKLHVTLGNRKICHPLGSISAVNSRFLTNEATPRSSEAYFFYRTFLKIGKGLKRLKFSLEHKDGRSHPLGNRTIYQLDRMEAAAPVVIENEAEPRPLSEYERWLLEDEPKLRSVNDCKDMELVFPHPLVWVIQLRQGNWDDIFRTLLSVTSGMLGDTHVILVDDIEFFEGKDGTHHRIVFESMPFLQISSGLSVNRALGAFGEDSWVGFLSEGDLVEAHFQEDFYRYLGEHSETELFYTDFDHQLEEGVLGESRILPAWNRDLLQSYPYIGENFLIKNESLLSIGGLGREHHHQKWALQLKFSRQAKREKVGRLCGIYFHLKNKYDPNQSEEVSLEGTELLQSHQDALGYTSEVTIAPGVGGWRTQYSLPAKKPKVSLLVPTRDGVSVLRTTIDSILEKTEYENYEILVLDNDSELDETQQYFEEIKAKGCRIIPCPGKFNYSQINNRGSVEAKGEILGFLNNDLEIIEGGWLGEMVSHACRKDVGAVGAKLLYPDGSLQHAGVLIGVGHVAAHAHRLFENDPNKGPLRAHLIQNFSAVTAACLIVRAEVFKEVGGFDDVKLVITNNDVDLCIKIREAGYRNVYTPYSTLFHHESATRGPEDTPEKFNRYQKEVNHMWKQWSDILMNDPAYNRLLTRFKEDFSLARSEESENYTPGKIF